MTGHPSSAAAPCLARRSLLLAAAAWSLGWSPSLARAQPAAPKADKAPSFAQKKAEVMKAAAQSLRSEGRLKDGWQVVATAENGTALHALVKGSRVLDVVIGPEYLQGILKRYAPRGVKPAASPGGVAAKKNTTRTPTKTECAFRFLSCLTNPCQRSALESIWTGIKVAVGVVTIDKKGWMVLLGVVMGEKQCSVEDCLGICKDILKE